jgi:hypothetical protein
MLRRYKNARVQESESTSESSNKCTSSPRVIPRGFIYRAIRGSVNIIQIAPNRPGSHTEYIVMRSLQPFMIYNHFHSEPVPGQHMS